MNCQNCSIEIPPTWTAALTANVCPACGQAIMNDQTQGLIKELSEALTVMPNNAEAIAGWIVSNYTLTKIAEYDPTQVKGPASKRHQAVRQSGVLTASDLLKSSKSDIDIDVTAQKLAEARSKIPSLIKEMEVMPGEDIEEEDYGGASFEVDEEEPFDKESYINSQVNRVMSREASAIPENLSKPLKSVYSKIALKQENAKQSLNSGSPQKGGFCRAE